MAKLWKKAERDYFIKNMEWNSDSFTDFSLFKAVFIHHPCQDKVHLTGCEDIFYFILFYVTLSLLLVYNTSEKNTVAFVISSRYSAV